MLHTRTSSATALATHSPVARVVALLGALLMIVHRLTLVVAAVATGRVLAFASADSLPWAVRDLVVCYATAIIVTVILVLLTDHRGESRGDGR